MIHRATRADPVASLWPRLILGLAGMLPLLAVAADGVVDPPARGLPAQAGDVHPVTTGQAGNEGEHDRPARGDAAAGHRTGAAQPDLHDSARVHPDRHSHDMPHPIEVTPSPPAERLLLDAYADGSLPARVLALHQALGARLDAHDDSGQTLLMKAAARDDFPLVQALVAAEVPLDATDVHGWSALEHAVQGEATDAALALITAGAVERVDHHQNSTLQYAVNLVADTRVVAALVAAGADVNRRSLDGLTVLMEALDAGNPLASIEALLEAPGIDPTLTDPSGADALAHARERGDAAITEAVSAAAAR